MLFSVISRTSHFNLASVLLVIYAKSKQMGMTTVSACTDAANGSRMHYANNSKR